MKKTQKSKSAGFTLIELLIVIIIIGILAAIAFVAYTGSQNKAHKADAQSTLSQIRSKLAEYNSDNSNYPATQAAFDTWLGSTDGGNNSSLASKFTTGNGYTYTPNDGSGGTCDNSTTPCSGYSAVASKTIFAGDTDITVTN
ncbi:MAG TPA: type IV pilin protein [Candidatus Saccharimonadales bacterium]